MSRSTHELVVSNHILLPMSCPFLMLVPATVLASLVSCGIESTTEI